MQAIDHIPCHFWELHLAINLEAMRAGGCGSWGTGTPYVQLPKGISKSFYRQEGFSSQTGREEGVLRLEKEAIRVRRFKVFRVSPG